MSSRRWRPWVAALLALLVPAHGALWLWGAEALRDLLDRQADGLRTQGYEIAHAPTRVDGYPARHRVTLDGPFVGAPGGAWQWRGERLAASAWPWAPRTLTLRLDGLHRVALEGGRALYDLALGSGEAVLHLSDDPASLAAEASVTDAVLVLPDDRDLKAERITLAARPDRAPGGEPVAALALDAESLVVPAGFGAALGDRLARLRLNARLTRLDTLRDVGGVDPGTAWTRWRDAGGRLAVRRLTVSWGGLDLTGEGDLTLDSDLRIAGRINAVLRGWDRLVDSFVAQGSLRADAGAAAKVILAMMARPTPDGGPPALTVPLLAERGALYLGPIRLAPLPDLFD